MRFRGIEVRAAGAPPKLKWELKLARRSVGSGHIRVVNKVNRADNEKSGASQRAANSYGDVRRGEKKVWRA